MLPKNVLLICIFVIGFISCKQNTKNTVVDADGVQYTSLGENITPEDALNPMDVTMQYEVMNVDDTIASKITAKVKEVCKVKGCWMILDIEQGNEIMVKFKDYDFFVPEDIVGKQVIINGVAFINDMSVAEQQHYAEDGGKTPAEIANILQPKRVLSFEADGILIKH